MKDWTGSFFYCKDVPLPNQLSGIPPFRNVAGEEKARWDKKPVSPVPMDLLLIRRSIEAPTCREPELTGTDTVLCWLKRRIQPCAFRVVRLLSHYTDENDALRVSKSDFSDRDFRWRVNQLITECVLYTESCPMYPSANPAPRVSSLLQCFILSA